MSEPDSYLLAGSMGGGQIKTHSKGQKPKAKRSIPTYNRPTYGVKGSALMNIQIGCRVWVGFSVRGAF